MNDAEKIILAEQILLAAEADDHDGLVDIMLGLVALNNPALGPFIPLGRRRMGGAIGKMKLAADCGGSALRWINPLNWF